MTTNKYVFIKEFFRMEAAGGILLFCAAILAVLIANTPFSNYYQLLLSTPLEFHFGQFVLAKPLLLWINDGLMALFFFLIGLELKREFIEGELADKKNIILPAVGAVGGMLIPAIIYLAFNYNDPVAANGWAIPAATDIAFALGILSLLGKRVPITLKVFLTSLAIFDDIGAILIIALFYTSKISLSALAFVVVCVAILFCLNKKNITSKSLYLFIGLLMWVATLKSGVHATLAGVVLAMFIPVHNQQDKKSILETLEHDLQPLIAFFVLPVFAFANAGINLKGVGLEQLLHPVPIGIALGLFIGKQIGVFGFCWLFIKMKWVELPKQMNLINLYGVSILSGVGFTMSLFIGSLAFEETGVDLFFDERLGIICGSLLSGIVAYLILHKTLPNNAVKTE